jgi:hypothetical protein
MHILNIQKRLRDAYVPGAENDNKIVSSKQGIQLWLFTETGERLALTLTDSGYQLINTGFSARLVQGISCRS